MQLLTVAQKVALLRQDLSFLPPSTGTASFVGRDLITCRRSFFPGGLGLTDERCASISTMVLGSDWGNEDSLNDALGVAPGTKGKEESTVLATDRMLVRAGFHVDDCWYSNAWPLMRACGTPESGYHPMRDYAALTNACRLFLRICIESLSPKLIVTMGKDPAWLIGPLAGESWTLSKVELAYFTDSKQMPKSPVKNNGVVFAAITHSSQPQNASGRATSESPWSREHEITLLRQARKMAGI